MERFKLSRLKINIITIQSCIRALEIIISDGKSGYICVCNSRTSYQANKDDEYLRIQNNSLMTLPDGMPLVWISKNQGHKNIERVSGKDLMDEIFKISVKNNYSHYFFGSSPKTIKILKEKLKQLYPGINIVAAISPPFQPVEKYDLKSLSHQINALQPTFFWCGLGAPKQEILISSLQPQLDKTISIGVGLAFEYLAESVVRAPEWMQKLGLEWIFRLIQQPSNVPRAIKPLSWVLIQIIKSLIRGKKVNNI